MRCWLKMDAGNFHLKRWWKSFMMEVLVIKLNYITHTAQQNKNLTFNWCRINLKYTAYYLACSSYDRITDCNMNHLQIQWMTEGICVPAKPARDFAHHFDIFMSINGAQIQFRAPFLCAPISKQTSCFCFLATKTGISFEAWYSNKWTDTDTYASR